MKTIKPIGLLAVLAAATFVILSFSTRDTTTLLKRDQMIADWERAKAYTKEYLDASTDDVINFRPMPEIRTFGQQMLHLAEGNYGLGSAASGQQSPVPFGSLEKSDQHKTKESVTKAVMDSYDFVIASLKEMDDQKMNATVKIFNFEMTGEVAMNKTFEHQTHHRGQATIYLRLKGITPPQEKLF